MSFSEKSKSVKSIHTAVQDELPSAKPPTIHAEIQ